MDKLKKLPIILSLSTAILVGFISNILQVDKEDIYVRMIAVLIIFFIVGIIVRSIISKIIEELVEAKLELELAEKLRLEEEKKQEEEEKLKKHLEEEQEKSEIGLNFDAKVGNMGKFTTDEIAEIIKKQINE